MQTSYKNDSIVLKTGVQSEMLWPEEFSATSDMICSYNLQTWKGSWSLDYLPIDHQYEDGFVQWMQYGRATLISLPDGSLIACGGGLFLPPNESGPFETRPCLKNANPDDAGSKWQVIDGVELPAKSPWLSLSLTSDNQMLAFVMPDTTEPAGTKPKLFKWDYMTAGATWEQIGTIEDELVTSLVNVVPKTILLNGVDKIKQNMA